MLKHHKVLVWSLVFTAAMYIALMSSSPFECHINQYQAQSHATQEYYATFKCILVNGFVVVATSIGKFIHANRDDLNVISTFFIALFTATLWFTNREQFSQLKRSVDLTERTFTDLERPYIFMGHSKLTFRKNGKIDFSLYMINIGRMIGNVREVGYKFLDRSEMPTSRDNIDWKWEKQDGWDLMLANSKTHPIEKPPSPYPVPHFFVAYITYYDITTNKPHTSWMCMHILPKGRKITACRGGGDAWNDCY